MAIHDSSGMTDADLSGRIDTLGWGILFVTLGGVGLVPGLPKDTWLIAAGVVMVGLSAARARLGLSVRPVTILVGTVALAAGIGSVAGLATAMGPVVLILLGLMLGVGALYRPQRRTNGAPLSQGG